LDTTQTMMVALDPEGRITMINRSGRELLGYAEEEILGCNWFETCLPQPEGRESVYPGFRRIMAGDLASVEYFENKIVCRDGTQRLMGWHNAFWEDDDGRVVGTLSSGEDITEHRQAEESLRESEQQFRTLFMESPVSITIHDKDNGEVLDANPKAYTSYGLASLEELKARGMFMEPPYSYTEALGSIRKAATKGPQQFEWLNRNIYGELFWEQARLIPMTINGVERVVATTVDITELKQTVEALRQSENYYRAIFETSGSAMFIMENDTTISHVNSNFEKLTGYSSQEIEGRTSWTELVHPDDLEWMKEYHYLRRQGPDMAPRQYEFRFMTRCDQWRDMSFTVDMIPGTNQSIGSGIDITERKQAEEELRKREEHLQAILQATPDPIVVYDSLGHPQYINHSFCQVFGWTFEELQGQRIPFVPEDQKEPTFAKIREIYSTGVPVTFDTKRLTKNNRLLDIRISAAIIQSASEEHYGLVVILTDITERKQMEQKLRRMSLHDALTGLYNRNFFEEQMKRLSDGRHNPLGIIVCDVNGLKFINDTLGHQSGDQVLVSVAGILRQSFRSSDIIARLGGDEFAVLLTDTDPEVVEVMLQRLRQTVLDFNSTEPEIPVSLSMGHALGEGAAVEMQALFREADSRMYREKIQRKRSSRSVILQAITQTMKARDFDTEGHCDRLQKLAISFAHSLDLAQDLVNDISLLARFHDLGKVGIPDHILFKPGPLTEEEWQQMRQHCEIGHRIASSVPDLEPIADYILKHHEYWDGSGYPLGLQGEDIPLVCRILAIVDAYDVMSSGRPYRQALTREEAISELRRFAGTQFDPELVEQFIQILEQNAL
ncbi:MAG: PAS domain S-box protein, partial [Thermodesulfobacteriota bacterium]